MAAPDSEMISQGEVESPLQSIQQQPKNQTLQSLGRQSSIYSLTLDEFQHALCESGKNFGSMNMDEFLNSIWTAEENQAQDTGNSAQAMQLQANATGKGISKQPSLSRQGSLTLPDPLCKKTVEEVWSEIHKGDGTQSHLQNPTTAQRQSTFGEMTLEDFLVRAGVVRAQNLACPAPPQQQLPHQQNSSYPGVGPNFVAGPMMSVAAAAYPAVPHSGGIGEGTGYPGGMKTGGSYAPGVGYGGRMGNGSGGFGQVQGLGIGSPVSPTGGTGVNQVDVGGSRGGRKRVGDGPVEKVGERRQRRMIKNRESAARSRARKQAYTVELEAELNQLKEENAHLKQALAELERKRKQQYFEEKRAKAQMQIGMQSKAQKAREKLRAMRRSSSC